MSYIINNLSSYHSSCSALLTPFLKALGLRTVKTLDVQCISFTPCIHEDSLLLDGEDSLRYLCKTIDQLTLGEPHLRRLQANACRYAYLKGNLLWVGQESPTSTG